jgi:serine/threonine-protein kinase
MIGTTIGKYRFVEQLGHGDSGTVYKAIDETLDREVAVKVLHVGASDPDLLKRFQAEAATLARLHHPDIVRIHEFQDTESDLLIVMELVRGETLDQLSARCGPLPPERAAYLVARVLGALDHAHQAGVVHSDLKPSNVMVTDQGGVKVMDFGVARVTAANEITADGLALGTPAFMAPERLLGRDVDGRADVYSAGVLLYNLLTGHVPHEAAAPLDAVRKQLAESPAPAHVYRPGLPGWCQTILDRALARSVDDRFTTADAFRAALLAAISEASETTGVHAAVQSADAMAWSDAPTTMMPAATEDPLTVAMLAPPSKAEHAASVPATTPPPLHTPTPGGLGGTTVVLKKNQFAVVGGLLAVLVLAVIVLAVVALRRPPQVVITPLEPSKSAEAAPAPTGSESAPGSEVATTPAASPPALPVVEIAAPPLVPPPAANAPRPTAAAAPEHTTAPPAATRTVDTAPFSFDARAVVADGDKRRERDAVVVVADGAVTVKEKNKSDKPLYVVPIDEVIGLTYSNSKQPLWRSPNGPAEAMRVEGGAFGMFKGERNWFGLRTKDALLVVRVDNDAVSRVIEGLQGHTGLTLERLAEPKD